MSDDNNRNSERIEKIYRIIEFEIDNANNQISLSKKDNINLILLLFALIGLFAFIPADTFFYEWISNGIWMTCISMGLIGGFSIIYYFTITSKEKSNNENQINDGKCALCKSSAICKNINDPVRKKKMHDYTNSLIINAVSLFFSALIYTSFIFFFSSMIAYMYYSASKDIPPTFPNNPWISILLMLILLGYSLLYFKHKSLIKNGDIKKYLPSMAGFSIVIVICAATIAIYGSLSKIPPFISISDAIQYSPLLTEHLKIIPSVPLSYIVSLYTLVILLVLFEFFVSSQYIRGINQKLGELLILKYRIDRYQLDISPDLDEKDLIKQLSKLKIFPPSYFIAGGIITIPVPLPDIRCEEMIFAALENQPDGETGTL